MYKYILCINKLYCSKKLQSFTTSQVCQLPLNVKSGKVFKLCDGLGNKSHFALKAKIGNL